MTEFEWTEDNDFRDELIARLHIAFGRSDSERRGVHISDLTYCLRKAWYRRQKGHVNILTDDSILYFVRGRSLHDMIEKLFPENEVVVKHDDVIGTVDAVDDDAVYEIKTTKQIWRDRPTHHNSTQLRFYMAMNGKRVGYLLYYEYFMNRLRTFRFTATEEQLDLTLKEISHRKALLELALENGNVDMLPGADESWECKFCEFEQCSKNIKKCITCDRWVHPSKFVRSKDGKRVCMYCGRQDQ